MQYKQSIIVLIALLFSALTHSDEGASHRHSECAPQTPVMVEAGKLVAIKDLCAAMKVIALSQEQTICNAEIVAIARRKWISGIHLFFQAGSQTVDCTVGRCQKFLLHNEQKWICAHLSEKYYAIH